jgi:hypothetical protein
MKRALAFLLILTACAAAQSSDKPAAQSSDKLMGVFNCHTSGHGDWIDNQKVTYDEHGRAHVSGDWEAPAELIEVCTLMVGGTIYLLDGTPEAKGNYGYIPFDKPVQFRKVNAQMFITDSRSKELEFRITKTQQEDVGVRKARIELCQQGIIKGTRCSDVPPAEKK